MHYSSGSSIRKLYLFLRRYVSTKLKKKGLLQGDSKMKKKGYSISTNFKITDLTDNKKTTYGVYIDPSEYQSVSLTCSTDILWESAISKFIFLKILTKCNKSKINQPIIYSFV